MGASESLEKKRMNTVAQAAMAVLECSTASRDAVDLLVCWACIAALVVALSLREDNLLLH